MRIAIALWTGIVGLTIGCTQEGTGGSRGGLEEACPSDHEFCATDMGDGGLGEDGGDDGDDGDPDLPYDVRPQLGDTFRLSDAFLEKGPLPAAILDVTLEGGDWRLAELRADTPFTITEEDCNHVGNRDIGRDRIFVTWAVGDMSTETDHLDMRYCKP